MECVIDMHRHMLNGSIHLIVLPYDFTEVGSQSESSALKYSFLQYLVYYNM